MHPNLDPAQNPPTVGTLAAAFWASLVNWLVDAVDLPAEVEVSGAALLIVVGAWYIGRFTQRFTDPKAT